MNTIDARRARAASALAGIDAVLVVGAGTPIGIPGGADQVYPFRPHPDYRWLTGRGDVGAAVAFDPREGWVDFIPPVTEAERLWEGRESVDLGADVAVHLASARPLGALVPWLEARGVATARAAAGAGSRACVLLGVPPEAAIAAGVVADPSLTPVVARRLLHARRPKDDGEIELMRRAAAATAAGYVRAREVIRPGVSEHVVAVEIEAAMFRAGGDHTAYDTIVASGPRSAILHGLPTHRVIGEGEMVLIDAAAAIGGYCADVTRVFAASGRLRPEQQALFDVVDAAQRRAVQACRPGVQWRDVHASTALEMAEGLRAIGLAKGPPDEFVSREAIALFFPHGVGHMIGLGVRDAGGRLPDDTDEPRRCCGVSLRVDLPLENRYAMTVEPGLYLVPAILRDPARRERFADCVNWPLVDRWLEREVGGVRIEDDVIVGSGEVLTRMIPHEA